jgi:hypothetical protein
MYVEPGFMTRVDRRIDWLRGLTMDNAVEEIARVLLDGEDEAVLWAAGALCAARYVDNQAHNLLGFVSHAMIGCEDARTLALGQPTATRHLLIVQALHQVVFDLHDPCLSPFELLPVSGYADKSVQDNIEWLRIDVRMGEKLRADHRIVALERTLPREELVDLLLDIGLEGMVSDDHTIISPQLVLGMMEITGWERGFEMLRCTLRYSASFPRHFAPYDRALTLRKQYKLESGAPVSEFQPQYVQMMRERFHAAAPSERAEVAARAMANDGISPETIVATAMLAGTDMYLMTTPVPHEDFDAVSREVAHIHINTSSNGVRSMLARMRPATRALAAVQIGNLLERGPSVLNERFEFVPFAPARPLPYEEDVAPLRGKSTDTLLGYLHGAMHAHDYRMTTAAVQAYADQGGAPAPLIALLTEVACTDDGTLLHNFKHLYSMVDEFKASSLPDRWVYLVGAARWIAWYAGKNTQVYRRAVSALGLEGVPVPSA